MPAQMTEAVIKMAGLNLLTFVARNDERVAGVDIVSLR